MHVGWLVSVPFGSVRGGGGFGPNGLYINGTLQECIRLLNGAYKKPTYLNKVLLYCLLTCSLSFGLEHRFAKLQNKA